MFIVYLHRIVMMLICVETQQTIACSKPTTETLEQGVKYIESWQKQQRPPRRRSGVFIFNFKQVSHNVLVFLLLT